MSDVEVEPPVIRRTELPKAPQAAILPRCPKCKKGKLIFGVSTNIYWRACARCVYFREEIK